MIAEGRTKFTELPEPFFKSKPIKNEWVTKGSAYIASLVKRNGNFSVSLMFLSPGSHVKIPKYSDACSLYQVYDTNEKEHCLHRECELVNSSDSNWLVIIVSERYKVIH